MNAFELHADAEHLHGIVDAMISRRIGISINQDPAISDDERLREIRIIREMLHNLRLHD